jgi:hypothetical protein
MPLPRIIGITGRKFNGKDTVGDYLVAHHGYTRLSFAEPIKDICNIVFGLDDDQLHGNKKECVDEDWGVSPRILMQFIGTELFRDGIASVMPHLEKDIWIHVLQKKMKDRLTLDSSSKFVITDMRFENEANWVTAQGGVKWRICRPGFSKDDHPSEVAVDSLTVDHEFRNDYTIEMLYNKIEGAMQQLRAYRTIADFMKITLEENSLVVLDIDDTLITFGTIKTWWTDNLEKYKALYKTENEANIRLTSDWYARASTIPPALTDKASIAEFLEECCNKNCKVVCLTARHGASKALTDANMAAVGLSHLPIFFADGENKGHVLHHIMTSSLSNYAECQHYKTIVFVDDQPLNLYNVHNAMSKDYQIQCYQYKKRG